MHAHTGVGRRKCSGKHGGNGGREAGRGRQRQGKGRGRIQPRKDAQTREGKDEVGKRRS